MAISKRKLNLGGELKSRLEANQVSRPVEELVIEWLGQQNRETLLAINQVIVQQLRAKRQQAAAKFVPGNRVTWWSKRRGRQMRGTVERVNRVSINVRGEDGNSWLVSASLLSLRTD
jgi:hypothetical protein